MCIRDSARIALGHVDMMFHVVCELGYPVGLGKAAEGFGLPGKCGGITGYDAPIMWAQGRCADVLEYNLQDARLALGLVCERERQPGVLEVVLEHVGAAALSPHDRSVVAGDAAALSGQAEPLRRLTEAHRIAELADDVEH